MTNYMVIKHDRLPVFISGIPLVLAPSTPWSGVDACHPNTLFYNVKCLSY